MPLTITRTGDWMMSQGDRMATKVTVAFDSSYPTGGEPLTPSDLGLGSVDIVHVQPKGGYIFSYDYTAQKLQAYVEEAVAAGGPLLEVGDTVNLSTVTGVVVHAIGK